jgi:hypothetical protein
VLRASAPAIEVVCAPTPELDELVAHMHESFGRDDAEPQTYLSPGVTPAAMGSFFEAAAALHRRAPWSVVPDDQTLIGVDIPAFEVRGAVLSIIGGIGESFGFLLFDSLADFHEFVEAAAFIVHGDIPELPPHFAVNFERGADLAPELRKEVATHGWEVAGAEAYPWPVVIDGDLVARTPSARELALAEACLYLALAPKSNSVYKAYGAVQREIERTGSLPVPLVIRNAVTKLMKEVGYGSGYKYAHEFPDAEVDQQHLPDEIKDRRFYNPTERGWEGRRKGGG